MCGIAGIIDYNNYFESTDNLVRNMLLKIRHRGPNQSGIKQYAKIVLGMNRLSIIDNKEHDIPYNSIDDKYAIVYNGEIYNYKQIFNNLNNEYKIKLNSDAEAVLYSYIKYGTKAFKDYNGMYTFAIYDSVAEKVIIARDKTGEKPLYYACAHNYFIFSSEAKALLEIIKPEINKNCLTYQAYEFCAEKETLFKNIYQLEPGEYIEIDIRKKNFNISSYWKIWDNLYEVNDDYSYIKKKLTELLEDAILLRTENKIDNHGVLVSGGLDSAIVAAISKPEYIYTCHYDIGPDYDELEYAKILADHLKKELIIITPSPGDFKRTKDKIAYYLDTPCTWTSFSLWMLLERISKDVKILLSGDGADELFSGYYRYLLLYHDEQIKQLKSMKQYSYLISQYYGSAVKRYAKLVNRCENLMDKNVSNYLIDSIGFYFDKMNDDIIHSMGVTDYYTTMQVNLQMADRLNMAFSMENRSPFLDYRIVQFAFSIPSKYKINNGITKYILKDISRSLIPDVIIDRIDKRGFSAPLNRWFGWDKYGKYDRSAYKNVVFQDWKTIYGIKGNI
ncbi:asparagine synthase (glutamine-hydrolyzing) [Candidatus Dependentiae bacterium]|nr:asparagine synthase (glutamine-hydrolyzing) [Candidatus Dependentiae bacterium]